MENVKLSVFIIPVINCRIYTKVFSPCMLESAPYVTSLNKAATEDGWIDIDNISILQKLRIPFIRNCIHMTLRN